MYRKDCEVENSFINYLTYISMFPQLIAGPIVRFQIVQHNLRSREVNKNNFCLGFNRFLIGLFKKTLLANQLFNIWKETEKYGFENLSIVSAFFSIFIFLMALYLDFASYSDMAIGMGKMLGFNYEENFNYPFASISITDFWRRWHISLSTWFRDYVYIPLGGSKVSKINHIRNILIVWILTGLWHGANYSYVCWGLYFGIILVIEKYVLNNILIKMNKICKHIYASVLILIGFVFFAIGDFSQIKLYFSKLFFITNSNYIDNFFFWQISNNFVIIIIGLIVSLPICMCIKNYISKMKVKIPYLYNSIQISIIIILFFISIANIVNDSYTPFLYFRF
ncbi:MAG: MBOAT family O-acyltransferase [Eubacteriales bacterium]|nr:MBOAT family O-acyltransferase [Eubacteriales bacterium]